MDIGDGGEPLAKGNPLDPRVVCVRVCYACGRDVGGKAGGGKKRLSQRIKNKE